MFTKYKPSDFDFSGKRVRFNGKALTKFDVAWHIEQIDVWSHATIIMDVLTYSDLVDLLKCKLDIL